jgi:hypothetical protein
MRKFIIGLVGSLIALGAFAGSASASATIDLIWSGSGNATTSVLSSDTGIVLEVWLVAGPNGSQGAGVSVDYSAICGASCVTAFASNPGGPLPFPLGTTVDTGSRVTNINAGSLPPYVGTGLTAAGQSWMLGTVTFSSIAAGAGLNILVTANDGTDDVLDLAGNVISGTTTFNVATINVAPVPEPGTLSLLGMGLGGLYMVGRRSSRKR